MYGPFDKQLELRNVADGAETATASETGVTFPVLMAGDFKAIIYVSDVTIGGSPVNSYLLTVETDSVQAFSNAPVEVGRVTVTGKGVYEIPLSGAAVEQRDPDAAAIRVKATLAGGTKSITYGAYLAPAV
jgi:hypothetical protein